MQTTVQFTRATAPTVVLLNKSTKHPAWDGSSGTEKALMCFVSKEVAETFSSDILGSMKSNFPAKRLSFDEWIELLKEVRRQGVEQCSVVFGLDGETFQKGFGRIDDLLARLEVGDDDTPFGELN